MRYLFFFVHPSKFHVFKQTINHLKSNGHIVDILITSKDVLQTLVKNEGWKFTNIFPKGRKMKNIPSYVTSSINTFRTIYRLYKYNKGKKYDLFITDDLLVYIGKLKIIPSIVFIDDDLAVVRQFAIILAVADVILSPSVTDLGKYNKKKIGFNSYKELAYLHPNQFIPDKSVVEKLNLSKDKYFVLRLVSLRAFHDVGKSGLDNLKVSILIDKLEQHGQVLISAERELPPEFEKYRIHIKPNDMPHILAFASLYIGDSQTMSSEAAILGIPCFRLSDFEGKISVMEEKSSKYQLMNSYRTEDFQLLLNDLNDLLSESNYESSYRPRKEQMLSDKIDLSKFMVWLFSNFPKSVAIMKSNPTFQNRFK
jgi:uncharacterized protein